MKKILLSLLLLFFRIAPCTAIEPNQPSPKLYRVLILWTGLGEYESSKKLQKACHNLGWTAQVAFSPEEEISEFDQLVLDTPIEAKEIHTIIEEFQPDFTISLKNDIVFSSATTNYLVISGCWQHYFDPHFVAIEQSLEFDGFLYTTPKIASLKAYIKESGKTFQGMNWYFSCCATKYKPVSPKKLFYCGFQWDPRRSGHKYQKMFSKLDKEGYLVVYGPEKRWSFVPRSRKGLLPFDGESICNAIREAGIALVLHSQSHMELGAPTSRIFEAASTGSVIITDPHPFIVKEFGDSVLYIDENKKSKELFRQIDTHVKWIFANPKKAEQMARKAHTIFMEKFTLESQLQELAKIHEAITTTQQ